MIKKHGSTVTISVGPLLFVLLFLKLTGIVTWSWWWIWSPIWLPFAAVFGFLIIAGIVMLGFLTLKEIGVVK